MWVIVMASLHLKAANVISVATQKTAFTAAKTVCFKCDVKPTDDKRIENEADTLPRYARAKKLFPARRQRRYPQLPRAFATTGATENKSDGAARGLQK
jgi:hypothetical protein